MKVSYILQKIQFEWDSQKAESNLSKHGISFETACEAFFDPFVRFLHTEVVAGETRDVIVGMTNSWQILYVVHTMREGDIFRIISARRATTMERRQYEEP
ncbi:MAG: BrnT family toxin [SAR324 cluster bacterium]|nr:BrnT family toxin [SAR324 cluster bacterium]